MSKLFIGCAVVAGVVLVVLIVVGAALAGSYNGLVGKNQGVDAAWAEVQNQYQRRADLVPNLVSTVSGAADFEKSTLTAVVQARASVGQVKIDPSRAPTDPAQLAQYQRAQEGLGGALSRLLVVAERYPDLKANEGFLNLQSQLEGTENRIATARQRFNTSAQDYNTAVRSFPTVLYAAAFGFSPHPYFEAKAGADVAPDVKFNFKDTPR